MELFVSSNNKNTEVLDLPTVSIKPRLKRIGISGRSKMIDPGIFYDDLLQSFENCFYQFGKTLIIDFKFEYISSGSSKWLFHILNYLQNISKTEGLIEVNWFYEDDDESILDAGDVLGSSLKIPFHLKKY
jgi:hypothetical protein